MSNSTERVIVDAEAPQWAHSQARSIEQIIGRLLKRIRELEARVATLEGP